MALAELFRDEKIALCLSLDNTLFTAKTLKLFGFKFVSFGCSK